MAYREYRIKPHYAGFGMWQQESEGSEPFDDDRDIIAAVADNGCALVELGTPEVIALGAEDIRGQIYGERGTIYAFAFGDPQDIGYTAIVED